MSRIRYTYKTTSKGAWTVTDIVRVGGASPHPVGIAASPPFEAIQHLLSPRPLGKPGDRIVKKTGKRDAGRRRRK
jgi:hypothetical protein